MDPLFVTRNQLKDKVETYKSKLSVAQTRELTPDERAEVDGLKAEIESLKNRVSAMEELESADAEMSSLERSYTPKRGPVPSAEPDSTPYGRAPAVHTKKHRFSATRAIHLLASGKQLNGYEAEQTRMIGEHFHQETSGFFLMPAELRDLDLSGAAGALQTLVDDTVIDALRKKSLLSKVGAKFFSNLSPGKFALPKQTGVGTAEFLTETGSATESSQTIGQVLFTPKPLAAWTEYSYLLTKQTAIAIDRFVEDDLTKAMMTKIEGVGFNGGGSNEPDGALQNSSVNSVSIGTHGGAITFEKLAEAIRKVQEDNADAESMYWVMTPGVNYATVTTAKKTDYPIYLNENGNILGYDVHVTNHLPSDLTKGTGTGLHSLLFGDFSQIAVASWGQPEVIVDPYTGASSKTKVHIRQAVDVQLIHPEGLCKIVDIVVS